MHPLEEYARDKEKRFDEMKDAAVRIFRRGEMNDDRLLFLLEEMYRLGHYVGHCRGERSVKEFYNI